jgi:polysaccharide lyase-like protein
MRTVSLCILSTLGLSGYLACHSAQTPVSAELPAATKPLGSAPPASDVTPNFHPLFYPGTQLNSLLAVFGSSGSRSASSESPQLDSVTQNSADLTVAQGTTSLVDSASDAPGDSSISTWASPKFFTDLSAFNITHFAAGKENLEVVVGITPSAEDIVHADDASSWKLWTNASAMLQLFYPKDSVNPARRPQGGSEFYAKPLDISKANNVTLEYQVFFPSDFDWVKGGKLPGLYGGHTRCSGGNPALDCFSTRMMWRAGGAGELYLVRPGSSLPPRVLTSFFVLVRAERRADSLLM